MSRYLVKNKYTYEKRRQTDYGYAPDNLTPSQNHVAGRFIYESAEPLCTVTLVTDAAPVEIALTPAQSARFAEVSGFMISQASGEGMLCRVTLWGSNGESFCSVCYMTETPRLFSTVKMDFLPVRMTLEARVYDPKWDVPEVEVSLTYGYVLNTLGEVGGQSHFYTVKGDEKAALTDHGGAMILTLDGDTSVTSPVFPDHAGTPYNMLMPRRNTVLIVLTNKSTAKSLTLTYATSAHPWGKSSGLTLALAQDAEPHAYYFNLSATPCCEGRLSQFILSAEGQGEIIIHRYTFEQEKPIRALPATILSCTADKETETVTVCGKLDDHPALTPYAGGRIRIYATAMANSPSPAGVESTGGKRLLGEVALPDTLPGTFTVTDIPLRDECTTLLPYQIVVFAEAEGQEPLCLCDRFYIENYRDFDTNPYAFDLPDYTVSVLDCGAYGDAIHDDTAAIQEAIDRVSEAGGGQVLLPGSCDRYGRRYMVTSLLMKSHVDLHFGDGAVLWQSQLKDDYDYEVTYGHDGVIPGINWTHCLHVCNLPLIQAANCHHIKITGRGSIRMMDTGSEEGVDMPGYASGCPDRIHVVPIGFFNNTYITLEDFEIIRCNNYHASMPHSTYLYGANIRMHEVKCVSGDGFGVCGSKHVKFNRCFFQSNDDGVVLSCHYHDPRGILWWTNTKGEDNSTRDITTVHSYFNSGGGKALAFITWGTSDPIQEREEISEIQAFDNILVSVNPVGAWPDNPYNGKQPFDNTELDDYSPVKNVRILGNRYMGNCTLGPIACTNVITDCGVHSTNNFRNGDFTLGGLANWSLFKNANPACTDTVIYADKEKGRISCFDAGEVSAAQGLYLAMGQHTFTTEIMTGEGGAELFVSRIETGEVLASKAVSCLCPTTVSLSFAISDREADDVFVGIRSVGNDPEGFAIFDRCAIISQVDEDAIRRARESAYMIEIGKTFDTGEAFRPLSENGKVYLRARAEGDLLLPACNEVTTFALECAVRVEHMDGASARRGYGYRFAIRDNGKSYRELRVSDADHTLRLIDVTNDHTTEFYLRPNFFFTSNDFHIFRLEVEKNELSIWIDGSQYATVKMDVICGRAGLFLCDAGVAVNGLNIG